MKSETIKGRHYLTNEPIELLCDAGTIQSIQSCTDEENLPWIAPGLVDLQINGSFGVDFNQVPLTTEEIHAVTKKLWAAGVTSYYPTVITNSDEAISELMALIAKACDEDELTASCIPGIHLEGPYISPEDGARGAHGKQFVTAPNWEQFAKWQAAAGGRIKIVTLSPEWDEAIPFIEKCAQEGIVASIGHTSATPEQIQAAVQAGARMSTHLGNGSHIMVPRHPNYIWEQLAADELWTCAIADGFHLPASVLKVFIRAKGEQFMLVSDAVYLCGLEPGKYDTHIGGEVVLTESGKLHLASNDKILAGSAQMLTAGIENFVKLNLSTLGEAWEFSSVRPAKFMGLPQGTGMEVGAPADLVTFEMQQNKLHIQQVFKKGNLVFN